MTICAVEIPVYITIPSRYSVKMLYKIVPGTVVPYFVGRQQLLGDIRETFTQGLNDPFAFQPTVVVLPDFGGKGKTQGKTQVALRYCHIRSVYRGVFWIDATSQKTVIRDLEQIAVKIKMPRKSTRRKETWKAVLEELASWDEPWLMVFDDYDGDDHLFPTGFTGFFPSGMSNPGVSLSLGCSLPALCPYVFQLQHV